MFPSSEAYGGDANLQRVPTSESTTSVSLWTKHDVDVNLIARTRIKMNVPVVSGDSRHAEEPVQGFLQHGVVHRVFEYNRDG